MMAIRIPHSVVSPNNLSEPKAPLTPRDSFFADHAPDQFASNEEIFRAGYESNPVTSCAPLCDIHKVKGKLGEGTDVAE